MAFGRSGQAVVGDKAASSSHSRDVERPAGRVQALFAFPGDQVGKHAFTWTVMQTDLCGSRPAGLSLPARLDQPHWQRVRPQVLGHAPL